MNSPRCSAAQNDWVASATISVVKRGIEPPDVAGTVRAPTGPGPRGRASTAAPPRPTGSPPRRSTPTEPGTPDDSSSAPLPERCCDHRENPGFPLRDDLGA